MASREIEARYRAVVLRAEGPPYHGFRLVCKILESPPLGLLAEDLEGEVSKYRSDERDREIFGRENIDQCR